jgi:DNA replication protein DnaC
MTDTPLEHVVEILRKLRLPAFAADFQDLVDNDPDTATLLAPHLKAMAKDELVGRFERTVKRRIQEAHFVRIQTVDSFDFDYNPSTRKLKKRYLQLLYADLVDQGVGAAFVGNSGLGKTHLARALGYDACQRRHRVLFIPCATMLNRLVLAEATKDLAREVKKLVSPALLIIDELAYLNMSHQEANLFFQVISRRHDDGRPTVVTTNKPFGEWNQVFHSDGTAHAIVDRLTESAEIFYLEGKSYRATHRKGIDPNTPSKKKPTKKRGK